MTFKEIFLKVRKPWSTYQIGSRAKFNICFIAKQSSFYPTIQGNQLKTNHSTESQRSPYLIFEFFNMKNVKIESPIMVFTNQKMNVQKIGLRDFKRYLNQEKKQKKKKVIQIVSHVNKYNRYIIKQLVIKANAIYLLIYQ
ncbi:hypothetical protein ABPG74_017131 [Tetrahymena malaccensis]